MTSCYNGGILHITPMTPETALELAKQVACGIAVQYHLNRTDLLSHVSIYLPGLLSRIDPNKPEATIIAYVKRSLKGYMLHYIRDGVNIIRTPRGKPSIEWSGGLIEDITPDKDLEVDLYPDWACECLESKAYGRRFANAYLRFLDT